MNLTLGETERLGKLGFEQPFSGDNIARAKARGVDIALVDMLDLDGSDELSILFMEYTNEEAA